MRLPPSVKSEIAYARDIVEAGLGATHTKTVAGDQTARPSLARVSQSALVSAAVGAVIGVLGICLTQRERKGQHAILGGLIGCAVGFGGGVAWSTRNQTSAVARTAIKNVQAVRDARWLQKNPIAYA